MNAKSRIKTFSDKLRKVELSMGARQPLVIDCPADADYEEFKAKVMEEYGDYDLVYVIRETHAGAPA